MTAGLTVWTIGHSNHDFDHFAQLLAGSQIEVLVDVRSYPYSRIAPHFNREPLRAAIRGHGIRYVYLGEELGGRPTDDEHYDADGHALYGPMSMQRAFRAAIDRVLESAGEHRVALVCSEGDPRDCHRRLLVGRVLESRGAELRHILADGTVIDERALSTVPAQPSLFEEEQPWRSTQSVSHRRRLSTSSAG